MRKSSFAIAVMAVALLTGCGGKKRVDAPPPPPPVAPEAPPPAPAPERSTRDVSGQENEYARLKMMSSDEIDRLGILNDVHYDFDKADIRESDRAVLNKNAEALRKFDFIKVTVEGHCDDRGTVDYNLVLGERRARAAADYLISLGISADRIKVVSYGKEAPQCNEATEECWARNRRAHLAVTGKAAAR
ncbi:MAG: peptidoglycan-associated lipoprotein Pal [Vicinamibacteria bacterium]|jgi:peptidoglycan-associated lipoprotein|nr:peptidoglycan-associated lipoprotein Pal [Vicinamibacteria bacterium]